MHRHAWEQAYGPIPEGMCVLHRCDNPPCYNAGHLFLGSKGDNLRDMCAKGRHWQQQKTHCLKGHEYTKENTYEPPNKPGTRECKACWKSRYVRYSDLTEEQREKRRAISRRHYWRKKREAVGGIPVEVDR